VAGSGPDKSFYQSLLVVFQSFQRSLAATRPIFVVGPAATTSAAAATQLQLPFSSLGLNSEPGTPSRAGLASHCLSPGGTGCHPPVVVTCTVESDLEVAIAAAGEAAGLGLGFSSSSSSALLQSSRGGLGVLLGGSSSSSGTGRGSGSDTGGGEGCVLVPTAPLLSGVLLAHQVLLPPSAATGESCLGWLVLLASCCAGCSVAVIICCCDNMLKHQAARRGSPCSQHGAIQFASIRTSAPAVTHLPSLLAHL
jgi:hypothetical protein